jgi:hypothetical protein
MLVFAQILARFRNSPLVISLLPHSQRHAMTAWNVDGHSRRVVGLVDSVNPYPAHYEDPVHSPEVTSAGIPASPSPGQLT